MAVGNWQLATTNGNNKRQRQTATTNGNNKRQQQTATTNDKRQRQTATTNDKRLMGDGNYDNPEIRSYRDLAAWQKARALVKRVYGATALFPSDESFGLVRQIRRAAVSVPSNIAEGYGRGSLGDYIRFLQVARGSLFELETQIILANDLEYLTEEQTNSLTEDIQQCARILQGLIASLKGKQ